MASNEFSERELRAVKKRVCRMGVATNYGLDGRGFAKALDHGVNYVFWTSFRSGDITPVFAEKLKADRERYVIATGPTVGWFGGGYRRGVEKALKTLKVDYLDVFHLFWLGVTSALTEGTMSELQKLKEEGNWDALDALPRNSNPIRMHNRCGLTGRPKGYMRRFGICRVKFRQMALDGKIPGITKASW